MKKLSFLVLMILAFSLAERSYAQKCDIDSGFRGDSFSIDRYARRHLLRPVAKLTDLPLSVREKIDAHLTAKLGKVFLKRIKFDGGEHLDLVGLRKESPTEFERNSNVGSYDLLFHYSERSKGLKYFYTKMTLFEDGTVANDINLPDINADPRKANLIGCKDASSIAAKNGFPPIYQYIRFDYSSVAGVFMWVVSDTRPVEPDKTGGMLDVIQISQGSTYRIVEIEAHTGKIHRIYKETIVL